MIPHDDQQIDEMHPVKHNQDYYAISSSCLQHKSESPATNRELVKIPTSEVVGGV